MVTDIDGLVVGIIPELGARVSICIEQQRLMVIWTQEGETYQLYSQRKKTSIPFDIPCSFQNRALLSLIVMEKILAPFNLHFVTEMVTDGNPPPWQREATRYPSLCIGWIRLIIVQRKKDLADVIKAQDQWLKQAWGMVECNPFIFPRLYEIMINYVWETQLFFPVD